MKKTTLLTAILLATSLSTTNVRAESSTEENVGFFSGAIAGAAIGGPIGFIIGGATGVLIGEKVEKGNQFDNVQAELTKQQTEYQQIQQQLVTLEQKTSQVETQLATGADWITQGLTLNLMFTTNSTELSDNDKHMILRLSKVLSEYPELKIKLDGYADPRGDEISNMKLSEDRIKSVEQAFTELGISTTRLNIQAHGENNASDSNENPDSYALDRRVSINFFTEEDVFVAQN